MICAQIAALPFQHQVLLKKFLEASVPDIDSQVMAASKAEWARYVVAAFPPDAALHLPFRSLRYISTVNLVLLRGRQFLPPQIRWRSQQQGHSLTPPSRRAILRSTRPSRSRW
jgi:hypothetical protein